MNRQTDIKPISAFPERYILSDNRDYLQRTIYFEAPAVKGQKTTFKVIFEYTGYAFYNKINPDKVKPVQLNEELKAFIQERPPHIVFTKELKELSKKIVDYSMGISSGLFNYQKYQQILLSEYAW
jgi:hypothetical protein